MAKLSEKVTFPEFEDIDADAFEVILDVDLDELTVMFYGRNRRHTVRPRNAVLSVLEDPLTGAVLGVTLSRFWKQVLVEHPHMIVMVMAATVLAGDEIFAPGEYIAHGQRERLTERFRGELLALVEKSHPDLARHPDTRSLYETTLQFT